MKRPPNDEIGKVACAHCGKPASVRQNKAGKLYYLCQGGGTGCGMITPNLPAGQEWVRSRMTVTGQEPQPKPEAAPVNVTKEPEPEKAPEPAPAKAPGLFASILDARIL